MLRWALARFFLAGRDAISSALAAARATEVFALHAESQLLRAHDRRAFRADSENQRLQRRDFRAKSLILPLQREHYFSERGRISRKVFRSKRHKTKLT